MLDKEKDRLHDEACNRWTKGETWVALNRWLWSEGFYDNYTEMLRGLQLAEQLDAKHRDFNEAMAKKIKSFFSMPEGVARIKSLRDQRLKMKERKK